MNERLKIIIGLLLIYFALFYKGQVNPGPVVPDKFEKPDAATIAAIQLLPDISDEADSAKLSGVFLALSDGIKRNHENIKYNIQVQYLLDFVGKSSLKNELMPNGQPKYPSFSPAAATIITNTIGKQDDTTELTKEEKESLSKIFYGFAWKLYNKNKDAVFEEYYTKGNQAVFTYFNGETPPDDESKECQCKGLGYIIHGDGHKTVCPCIEAGKECTHEPKCGSKR